MRYKIGQVLWTPMVDLERGEVTLDRWRVTRVWRGCWHAIRWIYGLTYVKRSAAIGDWKCNRYVSPGQRASTPIGQPFARLHTSKLKAYRAAYSFMWKNRDVIESQVIRDRALSRLRESARIRKEVGRVHPKRTTVRCPQCGKRKTMRLDRLVTWGTDDLRFCSTACRDQFIAARPE